MLADHATVLVEIVDTRWRDADIPNPEDIIGKAVRAALVVCEHPGSVEIGIRLTDDAEIRDLNHEWRGQDKSTNALSFALDGVAFSGVPVRPLGDVVVAFETCVREADAEDKLLANHLRHLVVHGTLHLLGFDHEEAEEAEIMEGTERRILAALGVRDPYADSGAV